MFNQERLRIMIVDDDEEDYLIIADFLSEVREVRYSLEWKESYKAALEELATQNYDVCLLDYRLGKESGMELLREIVKKGYRIPVILLTGIEDHEIDVAAMNAGASDFLVKNEVNSVILERAIRYCLERRKMEEELYNEKERALVTLDSIGDAVITTDIEGKITYLNQVAEKMTGRKNEEIQNVNMDTVFQIMDEYTLEPYPGLIKSVVTQDRSINISNRALLFNNKGPKCAVEGTASPIRNRENCITGIVIVLRDVSMNREMSRKITYQANHDALTGLINRIRFEEIFEETLITVKQHPEGYSLLFMDLDRFKIINDTCGHLVGDKLLKEITEIIQDKIRKTDVFARMGGDEFVILLKNCSIDKAGEIASFICKAVSEFRFSWQDYQFTIGISIGIIKINSDSSNMVRLLHEADEACYIAKNKGGNGYHIYQEDIARTSHRENEIQRVLNLNNAIFQDLFLLYFQPIIPLNNQETPTHYELLIRMLDSERGVIPPRQFLPAANRYKLMSAIDRWVIDHFFRFYQENVLKEPALAFNVWNINLSGSFLNEDLSLKYLEEQFSRYNVPPQAICFEITETSAIGNFQRMVKFMQHLQELGCFFALDDFGNGWATYNYLKNLPVDFVKIDGSFVRQIVHNPVDYAMVDSINQIAHLMKIKTVAEFVENKAILNKLHELGIDYAQGYYIGKPRSLASFEFEGFQRPRYTKRV